MSSYIDEQYIRMMGMYVDRFSDLGNDSYNCRCPICGDSAKSKTKSRGFFYKSEKGNWRYKCHNCAINISFYEFIERVAPAIFSDYKFEIFNDKKDFNRRFKVSAKPVVIPKTSTNKFDLGKFHRVNMSVDNEYTSYLKSRNIPKQMAETLYYTDNLEPIASKINGYEDKKIVITKGIIIPYYDNKGNFESFQIRNIDKSSEMRYLTYDIQPSKHIFNISNISPTQRVFVFEGAFDSMFCNNAVCASGSSIFNKLDAIKEVNSNIAVVFDNDYKTNTTIYDLLMKVIKSGYNVVIFDDQMRGYKDINEFAIGTRKSVAEITAYLNSCTYEGMRAELHVADIFNKMKNLKKRNVDFGMKSEKTRSVFERNSIFSL